MAIQIDDLERLQRSMPALGNDPAAVRQRVEAMEMLLERSFVIPGINRPVGLDSLIGLIPVAGDVITGLLSLYILWEARNLGLSKFKLLRMAGNVGIDTLLGAIPVAGDAFDFFWRSNTRNLRIIKRHLDKHHPSTRIIEG
ncbi:MAG: DUF4112 domain-containing protein [Blastomonas sp.]